MKTPREILFEKHAPMGRRLDAVRRNAVATMAGRQERRVHLLSLLWRELIVPCRRTWVGLACAWGVVALLSLVSADYSAPAMVKTAVPTPTLRLAIREQGRMLQELLRSDGEDSVRNREEPRSAIGPRSECRVERAEV
jgi:hypothetical protein